MRLTLCALVLATSALTGCGPQPAAPGGAQALTPERAAQVDSGVRAFMRTVALDVTRDGPSAWRKHFSDTPAFFMAVDGLMAFPDSATATKGIQGAAADIKHIELTWGSDLRVDPLTPDLAMVATTWHELQDKADGKHLDESGFFTGVAELQDDRWQFRDAHWSEPATPPVAK
jgi:hypothetical protein